MVPQKLNTELPYDLATPILGGMPKGLKARSQRGVCTPMFIAKLFVNQVPQNWWMDKQNIIYIYSQ